MYMYNLPLMLLNVMAPFQSAGEKLVMSSYLCVTYL